MRKISMACLWHMLFHYKKYLSEKKKETQEINAPKYSKVAMSSRTPSTLNTYGILSSEDTIEFKTLSVADRSARLEASNLLRTSSCDMACSGVTS